MALQKLREYFNDTNREEFIDMLKNRVIVTEKISSPTFLVRRKLDGFEYFKSSNSDKLTLVDRTIISLYEVAINYIQSLPTNIKKEMPTDWRFGFEYLPEVDASKIKYQNTPTNSLILNHIQQIGENGKVKKTINDPEILNKWSNKLQVQSSNVIFDGYLSQQQRNELLSILTMNNKDFSDKFDYSSETNDKTSFTSTIFKIFNPSISASALNSDLESEIDGLILNFIDGRTMSSFKIEDFNRTYNIEDNKESSHTYQIAVTDFLEFLTQYNLDTIQLEEENADYRYITIMSVIFNDYISKNAAKYIGVNFESAEFASANSFKLNTKYIKNEKTLRFASNEILAELFKIILSSFRKKRNKTSDLIDSDTMNGMNTIIDKISEKVFAEKTDENSIYDYQNFTLNNRIRSSVDLNEALNVKYNEQGKQPVNMFVGRFQPFTLGHAKVLEKIHKENGYPVVVFLVKAKSKKKGDEFSRPYDEKTQIEMFKNVKKQYPFLKEIYVVPTGGIDVMFNEMRPKYEPVLWGTGSDRMISYGYQVNNDLYRDQLNARPDFRLFEIPRNDDDISATAVRNAMIEGNDTVFKNMTPKSIHSMYFELKSKLEDSMGIVAENNLKETMTFEQFIKNDI
jgi:cytidyltransferase-like protein